MLYVPKWVIACEQINKISRWCWRWKSDELDEFNISFRHIFNVFPLSLIAKAWWRSMAAEIRVINDWGNGFSPVRRQAITHTYGDVFFPVLVGINFSGIWIRIRNGNFLFFKNAYESVVCKMSHTSFSLWFADTTPWSVFECNYFYYKWKYFLRYWPFVRGIHRWPVNSPHKGQWRGALMFSLICARINGWVNNREAGDWRLHRAHDDVTVMNALIIADEK